MVVRSGVYKNLVLYQIWKDLIIHYINREQQSDFLLSLFLQNLFKTVKMRDINQTEIPNIY